MAGGIGSRFWPKSRVAHPKQFLDILGMGKTLLQMTYDRFLEVCPKENIYIVTSHLYGDLVKEQLPDLEDHQIVQEPIRRNTAPCIAYVSHKIKAQNPNASIGRLTPDQWMNNAVGSGISAKKLIDDAAAGLSKI